MKGQKLIEMMPEPMKQHYKDLAGTSISLYPKKSKMQIQGKAHKLIGPFKLY